ncbi:MAG: glutamate-1-semialdehyde 2,1-aminomutase [Acidobacteriota bacterium]
MPTRSESLAAAARALMPGGVSSPVRAFKAVGGEPFFVERAQGCFVWDADGTRLLDYVGAYGPLILGHAHPAVVEAVKRQAERGMSYGIPTELEIELARRIRDAVPSMERLRFVSSGTEAVMSALRVARAATGRSGIVKVEGGYHGHADALLVKAGSGAATFGVPDSAGIGEAVARDTLTVALNDLDALAALLATEGPRIAALILEPVPGNMGCVPAKPGYLAAVRELTSRHGILLVFDEVITGFRLRYGAAQDLFGVRPDLTTLGKIAGGGLPLGCYGGRADLMAMVAPDGPVYQAGTLSGNPLATTAGIATLDLLRAPGTYERLDSLAARLAAGLTAAARSASVPAVVNRVGSMMTFFFTDAPVIDFATAKRSDAARFGRFFHAMLKGGVFLPPSQLECLFVSLAHGEAEIDATIGAARRALSAP